MSNSLILLSTTRTPPPTPIPLPTSYFLRPPTLSDTSALAALYFTAYPAGIACATLDEATEDIRATFAGANGDFWPAASALIESGTIPAQAVTPKLNEPHDSCPGPAPTLAAAIVTVHRAPWEDVPDCPFVIELFTAPSHRRQGLARATLSHALAATLAVGYHALALRVASDNTPARSLYGRLGFTPWPSPDR